MDMSHLADDELLRFLDHGWPDSRGPVLEHLAACESCSARYAEAIRTRPAGPGPTRFRPEEFAATGRRLYPPRRRGRFGLTVGWRPPRPALAAAALLAVALGGYLLLRPGPTSPVYRGSGAAAAVRPVAPVDATVAREDLAFEWRGLPDGRQARLQIVDLSDPAHPILERDVSGSSYSPTSAERDRLQPGVTYRWFLLYRTETGSTEASSAARFQVRRERR